MHQVVDVEIDLRDYSLKGSTSLEIRPLTGEKPSSIRLHSRQCTLLGIKVNEIPAKFDVTDESYHGEVDVWIPENSSPIEVPENEGVKKLIVKIDYEVHKPQGGVFYVQNESRVAPHIAPHMYTVNQPTIGATRLWLPCIDHLWERCTWDLKYTIVNFDSYNMVVVSNGELVEEATIPSLVEASDGLFPTKNFFRFKLDVLTPAHHIGFVAGPLEAIEFPYSANDRDFPKIIGYCLPGRKDLILSTFGLDSDDRWTFLNEAMRFFIDEYQSYHAPSPDLADPQPLKMPGFFPYSSYKLAFVDNAYAPVTSLASMSICSSSLLHPIDIIDQVYDTRIHMVQALASQWFGIYIISTNWSEIWLSLGLANYFGILFLRKLLGENDVRFRIKKDMERVCRLDVGRPPLLNRNPSIPLDSNDMDFMRLKASLVLYMLDKRLRRSGYNLGLPGIIDTILKNAQNGKLKNNTLSMRKLMEECQEAVPERFDQFKRFFQQWILGSGCPKFDVRYNLNRKKMVVEFQISQQNTNAKDGRIGDAVASGINPTPLFTGPMIVCVHEADGKSYEHLINIHGSNEKHQVPFHTKYKRIRRNTKRFQAKLAAAQEEVNTVNGPGAAEIWGFKIDENEKQEWQIAAWGEVDEKGNASGDTFEWIRIDEDFGWLCDMKFNQPDYMWATQLQKDIDFVAQYEAIQMLSTMPSRECSSTLLQTLKDEKYFCKVRMEAAYAMANCVGSVRTDRGDVNLKTIGLDQLFKAFKEQFCYPSPDKLIPLSNDFSNLDSYFLKKAIIWAISSGRRLDEISRKKVVDFLVTLLKYNDNANNEFSDNYYISTLISAIGNALKPDKVETGGNGSIEGILEVPPENLNEALEELERYRWRDILLPSYKNTITVAYLETIFGLMNSLSEDILHVDREFFLTHTLFGNYVDVRLAAFRALIMLDSWQTESATNYIQQIACSDPSLYVRRQLAQAMTKVDRGPCCWTKSIKGFSDSVVEEPIEGEPINKMLVLKQKERAAAETTVTEKAGQRKRIKTNPEPTVITPPPETPAQSTSSVGSSSSKSPRSSKVKKSRASERTGSKSQKQQKGVSEPTAVIPEAPVSIPPTAVLESNPPKPRLILKLKSRKI
ncbi:hypothetical protein G9A89_011441 [Geosiphon pyriformis]|nr:hypothetical protein G9A89_011441 [Geosiphon pyriformis]